jgi:methylated-DNA-[protein]-cysteine S-methyltransferase
MSDLERELRSVEVGPGAVAYAVARLVRRAEADVDVAYAVVDSPLGELLVAVTPRGLVRVAYPTETEDAVLDELAARLSPRILRAPGRTDQVRRELEQYFGGSRRRFEVPVDWALTNGFFRKVLRATSRIPFGDVRTYGEMATRAGSPRAYRAAGNALHSNPVPIVVPCHRVVHADGGLAGYGGGVERKEYLLALEGALE